MATIQCRVEQNPLTTPESYKLRFIPRSTGGYDDVAARLAVKNPVWTAELIKAVLQGSLEEIKEMLIEGMQVTLENACTFRPALHANLSAPDDPLPPTDELLDINISASRP